MQLPIVSIACITFNHSKYIRDAIEGFLMQKTTFAFEILIHDDCSTDGTDEIIKEYEQKYPDIILPYFQTENQYSKGVRGLSTRYNFPRAKGKYIALCDGDDYWTDPYKLQKQVDFLESHPDYVMTYHDAIIVDANGVKTTESIVPGTHKCDYKKDEIITCDTYILTSSLCFRNVTNLDIPEKNKVVNGDNFITSQLGHFGKGKFMSDIGKAVYRMHSNGVWSSKNESEKYISLITTYYWLHIYYNRIGESKYAFAFYRKMAHMIKVLGMVNITQHPKGNANNTYKTTLKEKISKRLNYYTRLLRYWISA